MNDDKFMLITYYSLTPGFYWESRYALINTLCILMDECILIKYTFFQYLLFCLSLLFCEKFYESFLGLYIFLFCDLNCYLNKEK